MFYTWTDVKLESHESFKVERCKLKVKSTTESTESPGADPKLSNAATDFKVSSWTEPEPVSAWCWNSCSQNPLRKATESAVIAFVTLTDLTSLPSSN